NYLTPELAEGLVRAKLTHLIISLDGYDEKSYLSYREGGDFNKLLENIKLIQEKKRKAGSKYPQIEIQSIHFKEYAEKDIKKIKALAAGLKPDVFTLRDDYSIYLGDRDKVKAKRCFWLYGHPMFRFDGVVQPCCFYYLDEKNNFGNVKDMEAEKIWNNEKFKKAREYFNAGKASGELKCESCDYFKYESQ
ncbi:MAG: SPASM domain-containing protein, partial [Patescibacteria group bacterium]